MDREKLKLIVKNLKLLVDSLESEVYSDTDAYNIFFPLFICWMVVEAIRTKSWKKAIAFNTMAGLGVGLFSFAWTSGWFFFFDIILLALAGHFVYIIIKNWKEISKGKLPLKKSKDSIIRFITFFGSAALFVTIIRSFSIFQKFNKASGMKSNLQYTVGFPMNQSIGVIPSSNDIVSVVVMNEGS